jgi:hypothetical protein
VGDDHDRELGLDLLHQVLDAGGGDGVERRAGLVHQQHVGPSGDGAGDAEPLLLATREAHGRVLEAVLHLVPQGGLVERLLDHRFEIGLALGAQQPRAVGDVVEDRLGERVGLLEHHADAPAHLDRVDPGPVERHTVVVDRALGPGPRDQVVHAVEAAQHGGLATTRRPDEGRDLVLGDVDVDIAHGPEVAVEDADALDLEDDRAAGALGLGGRVDGIGL